MIQRNEPSGVAGGDVPAWPDAVRGPGPLTPPREADIDDEDLDDAAWYELAPMLLDRRRQR